MSDEELTTSSSSSTEEIINQGELGFRFDLLKAEMSELQQTIRLYDEIALKVQGWAITIAVAASGLALTADVSAAVLLGMLSSVAFWVIDAGHRSQQGCLVDRVLIIENCLRSQTVAETLGTIGRGLVVPSLATHIRAVPSRGRWISSVLRQMSRPAVWALYVGLLVALAAIYVVILLGDPGVGAVVVDDG